jgi:hypothetical protein
MQNILKWSSDGGEFCIKKSERGYGGAYGVLWQSLRVPGVSSQAVGLCSCVLQEFGFSRREDSYKFILIY